ncbi:MAG TPA: glycosyltransferase 87 family protein [Thermoanaerobaculia bacterium]|jgi:hypothetical protein
MSSGARSAAGLAVAAGILLRIVLVATTAGTTDVKLARDWASYAAESGVSGAYAHHPWVNHPPLSLAVMKGWYLASPHVGITFGDLFRYQQVLADCVSLVCLLLLGGRRLALLYFLSPVAIFISAFHGNSDATMVMCVLLALLLLKREQPFAAGIALGAAVGIKILPLLLLPFLLRYVYVRHEARKFAASFTVTAGLMFVIPLASAGMALVMNVFGYRGVGTWWGPVSMFLTAGLPRLAELYVNTNTLLELALVAALAVWWWRRSPELEQLVAMCGVVLGTLIVFGAGFGVQYLIWPVAFLPFALRTREAVVLHMVLAAFLAFVYTRWSGGWPWWYADAESPGAMTMQLVVAGWVAWGALVYGTARTHLNLGVRWR